MTEEQFAQERRGCRKPFWRHFAILGLNRKISKAYNPSPAYPLTVRITKALGQNGPLTSQQLANDLNAKKETVERTLRRFRDRGTAQRIGKTWVLLTTGADETFSLRDKNKLSLYEKVDERKTLPEYSEPCARSVYFVEAVGTGFVKIGQSHNGEDRIKTLQVGCPYSLKLLCEIEVDIAKTEEQFKKRFAKYRHRGEWFYASKEIRQFIKKVNAEKKD